jgi:electron transport protein HydN
MNRFVIADIDQCIGCRTCEIACVIAHSENGKISPANFFPRLQVMKTPQITTPILCRQCENAPCANACPNDAISYQNESVLVTQSRCIGCKTCMVACPYGAMSVKTSVELLANRPYQTQANKCDLCNGRAQGPACVEVCPTGALKLMLPADMHHLQQEKKRRAAIGSSPDLMR